MMPNIVWKPQPQQEIFMSRPEDEVLYGGAAGGGKSDSLIAEALRQVDIPHYRGLILRRTFPQLEDLIAKTLVLYPKCYPTAKWNDSKHIWHFPSGAVIIFGSCKSEINKYDYQGKPYDFIGFDELTQFTYSIYSYIKSRNRPNGPGTDVYVRATANPGGIGHGWVKERFISPAPPMTKMIEEVPVIMPEGSTIIVKKTRMFVPATVFDNKILLENDPNYLATLATLPEAEKNALLYGDWDSFSGQVFTEWKNDSLHYQDQVKTHVIEPFRIPEHWRIYRGYDFGYAKPFSVGWYAIDTEGRMYRIRELYGCTGTPNEGVKWTVKEQADEIKRIEKEDENIKGRKVIGIADPSIFDSSRGESIGEQFEKCGIYWNPGDNTRIAGKMQYHYRFAFDKDGIPMFYTFNTCKHFIRTIPSLVYSEKDVEDIDTTQEDHIYDECRYVMMEHKIRARKNEIVVVPQDDPLNLLNKEPDKYRFYRV